MSQSRYGRAGGFNDAGQIEHDNLIAGEFPRVTGLVTVTGSGLLPRGTVLGRITASGHFAQVSATASDGSEIPFAILAEALDFTALDLDETQAAIYLTGEFNSLALSLGDGVNLNDIEDALTSRSIFLRTNQPI